MKNILAKIFGKAAGGIAEKLSNIIAKHTFSKEDRAKFENEMAKVFLEAESEMQQNVTERWKNDMNSDSWLSKNVRPLVLLFLVGSTVLIVFIDAGVLEFEVKDNWIDLLQLILITVIGAYFGGRSFEKIKKN
tara:strand:+ start:931 stop:1329 length:399 start_codon:yes stop_codon:yes gene_type:complete